MHMIENKSMLLRFRLELLMRLHRLAQNPQNYDGGSASANPS